MKYLNFIFLFLFLFVACNDTNEDHLDEVEFREVSIEEIQEQAAKNLDWKITEIRQSPDKQNIDYLDILDLVSTPRKYLSCRIVVDKYSGSESEVCCKGTAFGLLTKCCSNVNKQNTTFCTYERFTLIQGDLPNHPPLL